MFRRDSLYQLTVVFQTRYGGNWHVDARVAPRLNPDMTQIDDELYDHSSQRSSAGAPRMPADQFARIRLAADLSSTADAFHAFKEKP